MIRWTDLHDPDRVMTWCGAAAGAATAALSILGDITMQVLGVPLPVMMGAAAGAAVARSVLLPVGFLRAALMTGLWTVIGCSGAPVAQALLKAGALGITLDLPTNALSGIAAGLAAAPWWWQFVWPAIQRRLGLGGEHAQ